MSSIANSRVEIYDNETEQKVTVNSLGELATFIGGHVSTANSSTTALGADGVFTGTAEDVLDSAIIIVALKASHASATDGLSIQFSPDGTNWDNTDDFTIPAAVGKTFSAQPSGQYMRVVYTNGGTPQTYFRLQTIIKHGNTKPSSHRVQDTIRDDDDAELVEAVLKLRTAADTYVSGASTNSGNFKVSIEELESGVSSNSNTQLNVTPFMADGTEGASILGYNGTNYYPVRIDSATRSLQVVSYEHHEIHSGSHFFQSGYQDLSINNVLDFTMLTPNTTKWIHFTFQMETEAETNWFIYEGATATNPLANALTPLNNNRNSATTSGATLKYELQTSLANANADTDVSGATILDSGISGAGKLSGGSAARDNELILKQNTLYCFRAIATAAGYINFDMEWYEHTHQAT